jgi:hypothetical protein
MIIYIVWWILVLSLPFFREPAGDLRVIIYIKLEKGGGGVTCLKIGQSTVRHTRLALTHPISPILPPLCLHYSHKTRLRFRLQCSELPFAHCQKHAHCAQAKGIAASTWWRSWPSCCQPWTPLRQGAFAVGAVMLKPTCWHAGVQTSCRRDTAAIGGQACGDWAYHCMCSMQVVDITPMKHHLTSITSIRVVQQKHRRSKVCL